MNWTSVTSPTSSRRWTPRTLLQRCLRTATASFRWASGGALKQPAYSAALWLVAFVVDAAEHAFVLFPEQFSITFQNGKWIIAKFTADVLTLFPFPHFVLLYCFCSVFFLPYRDLPRRKKNEWKYMGSFWNMILMTSCPSLVVDKVRLLFYLCYTLDVRQCFPSFFFQRTNISKSQIMCDPSS